MEWIIYIQWYNNHWQKHVSNKFNDYFVNVGKTLAEQIPKSGPSFRSYLPEANRESIFLTHTDQQEIRNIMLNIRNSAPGNDGISSKFINPVIETLLPPLTYLTYHLLKGISFWT